MALIDVADKNQIKIIQNRIKKDCIEFNSLSVGNKVKTSIQSTVYGKQNFKRIRKCCG
jgi:hypothetical protein